jgi:hypothetical protein
MHEDDIRRTKVKSVLVEYARKKYQDIANQIKATSKSRSMRKGQGNETEDWCDIYTQEFCVPDIVTIGDMKDGKLKDKLLQGYNETDKIEVENYYRGVMINKTLQAEKPVLTGYNRFTLIPAIHTPRFATKVYPFGIPALMEGKQTQLNMSGTVALEALKSDIKNLVILVGNPDNEAQWRREAAKTNGLIVIDPQDAMNFKAEQMQRQGISPGLVQWYQWQKQAFLEMVGHRYAAEKGAAGGGLSGKAIQTLDYRESLPEIVKKLHLEYSFTQMGMVILEMIGSKMNQQQFKLSRSVDGKEQEVYYNTPSKDVQISDDDKLNVVSQDGIINDLTAIDVDDIDLSIGVDMDKQGKQQYEQNKALTAYQSKLMSRTDATKALFPKRWREIAENMEKEDAAVALVAKLVNMGLQDIQGLLQQANSAEDFMGMIDKVAAGGNGQSKPVNINQNY